LACAEALMGASNAALVAIDAAATISERNFMVVS
jgi:hypothetical protein